MDAVGFVLFLVSWAIPIAVLVYVLRALNTIVLGIRSVNEAAQRSAAALERMEAGGSGPGVTGGDEFPPARSSGSGEIDQEEP
ncbi:MAG: hypothetical protein M3450_04530 [Actinomycetota bacterium]|nr:hypothetical protein [Actinomycetota bacterium]